MHRGAPSCAKRRWFLAEHFYSSIDKPWFAHTGFPEYLKHCGLDHIEKFTRADWRLIHRSLGKPRRLSLPFLRRERLDLERYRATRGRGTPFRRHRHPLSSAPRCSG
jgi:hypothetical protein